MELLKNYWPIMALAVWLGYKWLNSRKIIKMLPTLRTKNAVFVDVRSESEFQIGHAPQSLNIPLPNLSQRIQEIPKNVPVVLCCASGSRSGMAKLILMKNGFLDVYNIGAWTTLLKN